MISVELQDVTEGFFPKKELDKAKERLEIYKDYTYENGVLKVSKDGIDWEDFNTLLDENGDLKEEYKNDRLLDDLLNWRE